MAGGPTGTPPGTPAPPSSTGTTSTSASTDPRNRHTSAWTETHSTSRVEDIDRSPVTGREAPDDGPRNRTVDTQGEGVAARRTATAAGHIDQVIRSLSARRTNRLIEL